MRLQKKYLNLIQVPVKMLILADITSSLPEAESNLKHDKETHVHMLNKMLPISTDKI